MGGSSDRIVIGRHPDCDVTLSSRTLARYHAQLVKTGTGYELEDLNSPNGTYVNGRCIQGRVPLADEDRIHVGEFIIKYHNP